MSEPSESVFDIDGDDFPEDDDGQLQLLEPWDDGLDLGSWMESLPRDDQYRSLRLAS